MPGLRMAAGMPGQKSPEEFKAEALEVAGKANVIIMCMGITPRLEGEEMRVTVDGFKGGDRVRIDLPDVQQDLIKAIYALGKPVVLVLLNGSAWLLTGRRITYLQYLKHGMAVRQQGRLCRCDLWRLQSRRTASCNIL